MTEDEMLAALRQTFPALDVWRNEIAIGMTPEPESELSVDDEEWPLRRRARLLRSASLRHVSTCTR